MQTRTYGELYKLVQSLAGVKSFAPSEQDDIANFINRRYFTAYSASNAWPRFLVNSEPRTVNSFKLLGLTTLNIATQVKNHYFYKLGDDSNGNAVYYPSNIGQSTSTSADVAFNEYVIRKNGSDQWELVMIENNNIAISTAGVVSYTDVSIKVRQTDTEDRNYPWLVNKWTILDTVNYDGFMRLEPSSTITFKEDYFYSEFVSGFSADKTEKQPIGEFVRIYKEAPNISKSVLEYDFFVTEDGANVINADGNTVYVTYKEMFNRFMVSASYETSITPVPEEFFSYIAHGAYADFLTMDGQTSKAIVESERADDLLNLQLEKVDIMNNNNFPNTKFSTYVNKQSR